LNPPSDPWIAQFGAKKFVRMLRNNGLVGSMGRVGACQDNAAMESFFALLQRNVFDRLADAAGVTARSRALDRTCHRRRRQRRLGRLTPIEFEAVYSEAAAA
jgi:transposase InsO family protein